MNNEKRIILLKFNLRMTASSARAFFHLYIPEFQEKIIEDDGYYDEKAEKKNHYFLICVSPSKIKLMRKILKFNSSSFDVTDEIVNDRIKTKELELFDLDSVYDFYKDYYFKYVTIDDIQAKIRARGTGTVNNFDFQIMKEAKDYELFSSRKVNDLLAKGFAKRCFKKYSDDECEKLDLAFYYNDEIARIGYENGKKVIKIELQYYSANREEFEDYLFVATLDSKGGFRSTTNADEKFYYIALVIARIFQSADLINVVKQEIEDNIYQMRNKLKVGFHFFVIRKECVVPEMNVHRQNNDIAVINFMGRGEAEEYFDRLVNVFDCKQHQQFIIGSFAGVGQPFGDLDYDNNDWCKVEEIGDFAYASIKN